MSTIRELIEPLGYHKRDVVNLAEADSEFGDAYVEARGYDADAIRNEMRKRAIEGGSDTLLKFLAEMRLPEGRDLRRQRFEGRIEVQAVPYLDLSKLSVERAQLLLELLKEAAPSPEGLPADGRPALELVADVLAAEA